MKLSPAVQTVIAQFATAFPIPYTDEASREWTHRLAEQLAFSFPTEGWGHKSASPTRPHSADVVAIKSPFLGWDLLVNGGSPVVTLNLNADSIDLAGQTFEPVSPVNHLNFEPTDPTEPPTGDLEARVETLEAVVRDVARILSRL